MKNILVIAAHPDDEVLGMGGYIAKLTEENKTVHLLIVTDGSSAQYRDSENLNNIMTKKKGETARAAQILGISSVIYGDLPDMRLDVTPHIEINRVIEEAIDAIKPDTVFTHFWGDVNVDHQCIYKSTMVAVRPTESQVVKEVYCYNVPSATEWSPCITKTMFMPNVFIDISGSSEKKYAAMSEYITELREFPHPRSIEALKALDTAAGIRCGMRLTEEFILLRKVD